jgi:hypothetical protein
MVPIKQLFKQKGDLCVIEEKIKSTHTSRGILLKPQASSNVQESLLIPYIQGTTRLIQSLHPFHPNRTPSISKRADIHSLPPTKTPVSQLLPYRPRQLWLKMQTFNHHNPPVASLEVQNAIDNLPPSDKKHLSTGQEPRMKGLPDDIMENTIDKKAQTLFVSIR